MTEAATVLEDVIEMAGRPEFALDDSVVRACRSVHTDLSYLRQRIGTARQAVAYRRDLMDETR